MCWDKLLVFTTSQTMDNATESAHVSVTNNIDGDESTDQDTDQEVNPDNSQHEDNRDENEDISECDEFDYDSESERNCDLDFGVGNLDDDHTLSYVLSASADGWLSPATEKTLQKAIKVLIQQSKPRHCVTYFLERAAEEALKYEKDHPDEELDMCKWNYFMKR